MGVVALGLFAVLAQALPLSPTIGTDFAPLTNNCIAPRVAVDLAGKWAYSTDGQKWTDITIPCKNRVDADVVHQFRRTFTTPKGWKAGDRALVNFEVIGYDYEVFVNGERAAAHGYSYGIPQRVDISRWTKPGENELLVKTVRPGKKTPGHEDEFRDFPKWSYPEPWCPLGIVMPVHLEFTGPVSVEGVFVKPHVEGGKRLEVEVCVTNSTDHAFSGVVQVRVETARGASGAPTVSGSSRLPLGGASGTPTMSGTPTGLQGDGSLREPMTLKPGEGRVVTLKGDWPTAHLWTPDDPWLYNLDVSLAERATPLQDCRGTARTALVPASQLADARRIPASRQVDAYRVRFGFREIKVKGHRFYLNGHPFIARASTHLPDQRRPADDYRAFFARCKAAGVNSFRSRYREHTRTLELADECGVFIMPQAMDSVCSNKHSPIFWQRFRQQLREMVRAYRNHPSVLLWGLSNEFGTFYSGALGRKGPEGEKEGTDRQAEAGTVFTAEDPTRVWTACGDVDLCYPARGRNGPAPTRSFHYPVPYCANWWCLPATNTAYWYATGRESWQNNSEKDKPLCITEDLYHGVLDTPFGVGKYANDTQWTVDGWCKAIHWIVHEVAAGFYASGLGWWDLWTIEKGEPVSHYRDYGQMMPDFLIAMEDPTRNLRAGEPVARTLRIYNETFTPHACVLTCDGKTLAEFDLPQGEGVARTVTFAPPVDLRGGADWTRTLVLTDRKTGKELVREAFGFRVFSSADALTRLPREIGVYARAGSPLHRLAAPGRDYAEAREAVGAVRALVVDRGLSAADREILERFVHGGGKILHFIEENEKLKSAEPYKLETWMPCPFAFRRDPDAMTDFPEAAFGRWRPEGFVSAGYVVKPNEEYVSLWEGGTSASFVGSLVGRIFRGKGHWMFCKPPVLAKYASEPCCPALFRSLVREFCRDVKRPAGRVEVVSATGGSRLAEMMGGLGVSMASNGAPAKVLWVDAAAGLPTDLLRRAIGAAKGGKTVIVTDIPADVNTSLWANVGLEVRVPKTGVRTLHPFLPSWIGADSDSDQGVKWVTIDKENPGLLRGVANDDLYWWTARDFVGYIPNLIVGFPPRGAAWNSKERNVMVACTATLAARGASGPPTKQGNGSLREPKCRATVCTTPGAWAELPIGKGLLVLSTLRLAASADEARPRVNRFLRRVLQNAGVATAKDAEKVFHDYFFVDLKPVVNRAWWHDPKYRRADGKWSPAVFLGGDDEQVDLRYFPVNLCGWSQISRAPCPREEFPEGAVDFGGESFKLVNPTKNGGIGVLGLDNDDKVSIGLGAEIRCDEMHLLLSHAAPGLKVAFGGGELQTVKNPGPFLHKRGEYGTGAAWWGKTDDGRDTVLYHVVVRNPQPDRPVSRLVLANPSLGWRKSKPAAVIAITLKSVGRATSAGYKKGN